MVRKIELTKEEKDFIKHHYAVGELSISEIARQLGYDRGVIKRNADKMGLVKVFPKGTRGKPFLWTKERDELLNKLYGSNQVTVVEIAEKLGTSEDTATKRAKILGLNKVSKVPYTESDIDYIRDKAQSISISKIANHIGLSHEFVRQKIQELGLKNIYFDEKKKEWALMRQKEKERIEKFYESRKRPGEAPITDDEFLWDLSNPAYTTYYLGEKYDLDPATIGNWRKRLLGDFRASPNPKGKMTKLESDVSKILINDFDVTYFFEHKIEKWNVDFYLGNKKIIEAQGSAWHNSEKVIEKDRRKKKELEELGYSILYIHENDFYNNKENIKKEILGLLQQ